MAIRGYLLKRNKEHRKANLLVNASYLLVAALGHGQSQAVVCPVQHYTHKKQYRPLKRSCFCDWLPSLLTLRSDCITGPSCAATQHINPSVLLLQGAKYKRRWVELTADTLVHASSQQELLTGKVQIFSLHELVWIKTDGDNKFQVRVLVISSMFVLCT